MDYSLKKLKNSIQENQKKELKFIFIVEEEEDKDCDSNQKPGTTVVKNLIENIRVQKKDGDQDIKLDCMNIEQKIINIGRNFFRIFQLKNNIVEQSVETIKYVAINYFAIPIKMHLAFRYMSSHIQYKYQYIMKYQIYLLA